jgi:hypothetical protein
VVGRWRNSNKRSPEPLDPPLDLAARIGMPAAVARAEAAAPEPIRRLDGPIGTARSRGLMIGANESPPVPKLEQRSAGDDAKPHDSPRLIGLEEPGWAAPAPTRAAAGPLEPVAEARVMEYAPLAAIVREAPGAGEIDLVVTPLPTPDDWHHFELALRRVPGVGPLRIEYYRAGILKLRVRWSGLDRFSHAVGNMPGYRVGILGEDRSTVQIRVARG